MLSSSPSEGTPAVGSYGCTPQSLPKFQHPSHELLKENGFTQHVYHKYRRRCLNGRDTHTAGRGAGCLLCCVGGQGTAAGRACGDKQGPTGQPCWWLMFPHSLWQA